MFAVHWWLISVRCYANIIWRYWPCSGEYCWNYWWWWNVDICVPPPSLGGKTFCDPLLTYESPPSHNDPSAPPSYPYDRTLQHAEITTNSRPPLPPPLNSYFRYLSWDVWRYHWWNYGIWRGFLVSFYIFASFPLFYFLPLNSSSIFIQFITFILCDLFHKASFYAFGQWFGSSIILDGQVFHFHDFIHD